MGYKNKCAFSERTQSLVAAGHHDAKLLDGDLLVQVLLELPLRDVAHAQRVVDGELLP